MSILEYQKFIEKHSADPTQAGFDFQFYAFMYLVLEMDKGDSVQYETEDDIVFLNRNGERRLIQAKYAVLGKDHKVPNFTLGDKELWHTIHNWIIGFEKLEDQDYFTNRKFEIWTDKNFNNNSLYNNILSFKHDKIESSDIDLILDQLIEKRTENNGVEESNEVTIAMQKLRNLPDIHKKRFFRNFSMVCFQEISIIDEIKGRLEQRKSIPSERVNDVYKLLFAEIKEDSFIDSFIRKKKKLSAEYFNKKYKRCFNKGFDRQLNINRNITQIMPENICSHKFMKQLLDIKIVSTEEHDKIQSIFNQRFCTKMNIDILSKDGELLYEDLRCLEAVAKYEWETEFGKHNDKIQFSMENGESVVENEIVFAARCCYWGIRDKELDFNDDRHFDKDIALGYFYEMSDEPRIGWRYDWEQKYK